MSSKQSPASLGTGDDEELSPEDAAERKAACQQISDGLQASVRAWNKRGKEKYEVEAKVVQSPLGTFLTDAKAKVTSPLRTTSPVFYPPTHRRPVRNNMGEWFTRRGWCGRYSSSTDETLVT